MKIDGSDATKQVATQQGKSLKDFIQKMSLQIKNALPANITPERMMRIAMTAISKDSKLANSTPESFMGALLTSAQLGLECNTPLGQAYLIPFYNGKAQRMETQFQLGYQGLLDLCYRTGQYKTIQARIVYRGDDFNYSYGLDETLNHKPQGISKDPIFVYAYYCLANGAKAFEVMSWDDVMQHANKYSQSANSNYSPWKTDPESMAKKTVLKKVLKYAPKTVEIAESIENDTSIINTKIISDGSVQFIKTETEDIKSQEPVFVEKPIENKSMELSKEEEKQLDESFELQMGMNPEIF